MSSKEQSPEEKYRALIVVGIILSVILIIGIVITFAVTRGKIAGRNLPDYDLLTRQLAQNLVDSLRAADDLNYVFADTPLNYYTADPSTIEQQSDSLMIAIKKQCMDCPDVDTLLRYIQSETDLCAKEIRELLADFQDTLRNIGVSKDNRTTEAFFSSTEHDEHLLSHLMEYRERTVTYSEKAGGITPENYIPIMPLTDRDKVYAETQSWDSSIFSDDPDTAILFLEHLELDLRYFENGILWTTTQ